jgi:serine/threonine protein kinase
VISSLKTSCWWSKLLLNSKDDYQLKIVDFGLARKNGQYENSYIQSRYYRAPEVILGLGVSEAIDMWSLGCTLAELYLGIPIFPGNCNLQMLLLMSQVLG